MSEKMKCGYCGKFISSDRKSRPAPRFKSQKEIIKMFPKIKLVLEELRLLITEFCLGLAFKIAPKNRDETKLIAYYIGSLVSHLNAMAKKDEEKEKA